MQLGRSNHSVYVDWEAAAIARARIVGKPYGNGGFEPGSSYTRELCIYLVRRYMVTACSKDFLR